MRTLRSSDSLLLVAYQRMPGTTRLGGALSLRRVTLGAAR